MFGKTKHMDIQFHFIRGLVADGKITLKHCKTDVQITYLFAKPLPASKRNYFKMVRCLQL